MPIIRDDTSEDENPLEVFVNALRVVNSKAPVPKAPDWIRAAAKASAEFQAQAKAKASAKAKAKTTAKATAVSSSEDQHIVHTLSLIHI